MADELMDSIMALDAFFTTMIDMIPRNLYKPSDEEEAAEAAGANAKYYKHRKQPLAPDVKKTLSKQRIQEKYGHNNGANEEVDGEEEDATPAVVETPLEDMEVVLPEGGSSVEALRQRLQNRIQNMKQQRSSTKPHAAETPVTNHRDAKPNKHNNRAKKAVTTSTDLSSDLLNEFINATSTPSAPVENADVSADIAFSTLTGNKRSITTGAPGSKLKRLKQMVEAAEEKRARLEALRQAGDKETVLAQQWDEALKEAEGVKTLNDTKKLKKNIKRIEKQKEKSALQWQERLSAVEQAKADRQQKREDNINKRRQSGIELMAPPETPMEKKKPVGTPINSAAVKRKLPANSPKEGSAVKNRAGFEGKKSDILNKKKGN